MDEKSIVVGSVMSKSGCWSLLKGGFTVDQYMKAQLYFLSNNTYVRLWLDNVSLKSFAKGQWSKQQEKSTLEELFAPLVVLLRNPLAKEQLATQILTVILFYLCFVAQKLHIY
ncbi:endo-1,4-beta-xylanase A-like [Olea europaea subsp. europaea]|uniref:Endo-1,4-beta-xylanase A-like n=1 Tax=Olea europaea subsp. europaea TaxID=158383 RepID=A0A8S0RH89_OLEEU|nr:endo-1,4-beta-xylanase A-like [Olea europaea subsp. europaea]